MLNGNQTAALAFNYLTEARKKKGISGSTDMVITTIVTTPMIDAIARANGVRCYRVLTGFKWIAEQIRQREGTERYIIGGEESFGLMIGDRIRDKDGISAVALLCEMAAYEKDNGRSLYDKLIELYVQHGLYKEHLVSITRKGMDGQQQIAAMMDAFRTHTPRSIGGSDVVQLLDYRLRKGRDLPTGSEWPIDLPASNVLQFVLADGSVISARPSGTEPKIKFYFSVRAPLASAADYAATDRMLGIRIQDIIVDLKLE